MNIHELNRHLEAHKHWLGSEGIEGERLNLDGESLSGLNLRGVLLDKASLRGTDLHQADLSHASLTGANLFRCDLRKADLHGARLSSASLRNVKLQCTDFSMADLWGADLFKSDLRGACLQNTRLPDNTWLISGEYYDLQITNGVSLRVGCQEHSINDWRYFSSQTIRDMDGERALAFYPRLLDILDNFVGTGHRPAWLLA